MLQDKRVVPCWALVLLLAAPPGCAAALVAPRRPDASTWARTPCGSPSGGADIPSRWAADVSADKTPLSLYPRPQLVRGAMSAMSAMSDIRDTGDPSTWQNLNGLWEWEPTTATAKPPFGRALNGSILVPFPVESCLSGVAPNSSAEIVQHMWYRLPFTTNSTIHDGGDRTLLHFGAIDWQSTVYLNGKQLLNTDVQMNHTGGYSGISFDITEDLGRANELLVYAYDPSDNGAQPNGKQRISAIDKPGGDRYTPSSGIWQTVWLESVPGDAYVSSIDINQASMDTVTVAATVTGACHGSGCVKYEVLSDDGTTILASASGGSSAWLNIKVPAPAKTWSPTSPHLYGLRVTTSADTVLSYFGLRTFALSGQSGQGTTTSTAAKPRRPLLNGNFTFLAGFLDQSWWPDGQYTAPTDEALAFDIEAVPTFGLNMIRLHQKVNPERWYYHADRLGVVVFQDMVQKYGGATKATIPLFVADLRRMIRERGNHPCIVQWTTFNEGDCWQVFDTPPYAVADIVKMAAALDNSFRLVDTDSGGGANNQHIGDVNDVHDYPNPGNPMPSSTQYAMVGEFGGIGAFVAGKEWKPGACHTYLHVDTPANEAAAYVKMAGALASRAGHISASVYTQTTDVELECDGFLNYDRTSKFSAEGTAKIKAANEALVEAGRAAWAKEHSSRL
jgi:hypothetical protein